MKNIVYERSLWMEIGYKAGERDGDADCDECHHDNEFISNHHSIASISSPVSNILITHCYKSRRRYLLHWTFVARMRTVQVPADKATNQRSLQLLLYVQIIVADCGVSSGQYETTLIFTMTRDCLNSNLLRASFTACCHGRSQTSYTKANRIYIFNNHQRDKYSSLLGLWISLGGLAFFWECVVRWVSLKWRAA